MKYVSVAEMIEIEKESDASGHSYSEMMENAGKGLAQTIHDAYSHHKKRCALGLIGSGNNGGDTLVAFCYLQEWGWDTNAWIVKPRAENDPLVDRFLKAGGSILEIEKSLDGSELNSVLKNFDVLHDGVFGTGIRLPLRGSVAEILDRIRCSLDQMELPPFIVAVDCPSGIDCDTGEAAPECIPADMTVTMAAIKQGLLKFPAYSLIGDLKSVGIGLPEGLESHASIRRDVVDQDWVRQVLPLRPLDAHKSTFGVVMIIAGSIHYSGAALLSGKSAFRSGAGWVTLAVPEPLHSALAGSFVEATWLSLPHVRGWIGSNAAGVILENLDRVTSLLIGPGIGIERITCFFLKKLIESRWDKFPSLILDADGLKLLAQISDWPTKLPYRTVLTPHPGEMAILTGLSVEEIQSNRIEIAEKFAKEWGHIVVLKGAFTLIADPGGNTSIIQVATPALARAGTGDVLAGLITGLRAQGLSAFDAASAGAWIHAQAGLHAAEVLGSTATVLAGDVMSSVVNVLAMLEE